MSHTVFITTPASGRFPASSSGSRQPAWAGFLPKEHGSWSLALEPLALGLLIAPTAAGLALATASFAGFLARRPLKGVCVAMSVQSRMAACRTTGLLTILAMAGLAESAALAGPTTFWPLLLAVPLGGLYVYLDAQGNARVAAAELTGSATFAVLPAAMATLAGWTAPSALALAVLAVARSTPTVLAVRTYLRARKDQPVSPAVPLLAAALALGLVLLLINRRFLPALTAVAGLLLLLKSVWLLGPWRPEWSARRVGLSEAAFGATYLVIVVVAYGLR